MQSLQTAFSFGRPEFAGEATLAPISLVIRNCVAREGLRRILADNDFQVVVSAAHVDESILEDIQASDIAIVDDIDALLETSSKAPGARLVLLESEFDLERMNRAFALGAYAYVLQDISFESFVATVQLVASGQKVAPTELIERLPNICPRRRHTGKDVADAYGLRGREIEILDCLLIGMPNKAISRELAVSEATVKLAVKGILRKMAVENRTQAAIVAQRTIDGLQAP